MKTNPMMQKNPFMSAWLSAANSTLGAGRGLWMAEVRRQQTATMAEFNKQVMRFWTGAWMNPPAARASASGLGTAELGPSIAEPGAASKRGDAGNKAAQLRTLVERRTAGPAKQKTRTVR